MTSVTGYHAHVYFTATNRPVAERLRDTIISEFAIEPGELRDDLRGPHPISQFNVIFRTDQF